MKYDIELFKKFRELAITDVKNLIVGNEYWFDHYGKGTILKFMTNAEHYEEEGLTYKHKNGDAINWIKISLDSYLRPGEAHVMNISLADSNVGESYNPWLIFDNEHLYKAKNEMLIVSYEDDYLDDDWNDYFDDDWIYLDDD